MSAPQLAPLESAAQRDRSRTPEARRRTLELRAARARKLAQHRIGGAL